MGCITFDVERLEGRWKAEGWKENGFWTRRRKVIKRSRRKGVIRCVALGDRLMFKRIECNFRKKAFRSALHLEIRRSVVPEFICVQSIVGASLTHHFLNLKIGVFLTGFLHKESQKMQVQCTSAIHINKYLCIIWLGNSSLSAMHQINPLRLYSFPLRICVPNHLKNPQFSNLLPKFPNLARILLGIQHNFLV